MYNPHENGKLRLIWISTDPVCLRSWLEYRQLQWTELWMIFEMNQSLDDVQVRPTHLRPIVFGYSNEPLIKITWSGNCDRLHKKLYLLTAAVHHFLTRTLSKSDWSWIYHSWTNLQGSFCSGPLTKLSIIWEKKKYIFSQFG